MMTLLILVLLFGGSLIWLIKSDYEEVHPAALSLVSGILLFLFLITIPSSQSETKAKIQQFRFVEHQYIKYKNSKRFEQRSVAFSSMWNHNVWLIKEQAYNDGVWFDLHVPDEIETLKPIE